MSAYEKLHPMYFILYNQTKKCEELVGRLRFCLDIPRKVRMECKNEKIQTLKIVE
jgi:hypothetical protein